MLIDSGANVNAEAQDGLTSLQFATQAGHLKAVEELLLAGAEVNCKVSILNLTCDLPKCDHIFVWKFWQMKKGKTPLMTAAAKGNEMMSKLLLRYDADPTIKDKQGKTAADFAKTQNIKDRLHNPEKRARSVEEEIAAPSHAKSSRKC